MRASWWLLAMLLTVAAASVASGFFFREASAEDQQLPYAIAIWPMYVLIYAWMKADARQRSVAPPPGAIPIIALVPPLAVLYYFGMTRRRWGRILALFSFCGFLFIVGVLAQYGQVLGAWIAA